MSMLKGNKHSMNTVVSRTDYLPFGVRMTGNGLTESIASTSAVLNGERIKLFSGIRFHPSWNKRQLKEFTCERISSCDLVKTICFAPCVISTRDSSFSHPQKKKQTTKGIIKLFRIDSIGFNVSAKVQNPGI